MRAKCLVLLAVAFGCQLAALRADVISDSSITAQLQILPSAGSVEFLPGFFASVFAQAQDSLGGSDQQFNSVPDGATSASAMTSLANASGTALFPQLNASSASGVDIPNITAFASSAANGGPFGSLFGQFEIMGAPGPVSVQFTALLNYSQLVLTTGAGVSASSEVIFNLLLPDVSDSPILFLDNPLSIGPNAFQLAAATPTRSNSVTLQPGTPYTLILGTDAESSGVSTVPEPSTAPLLSTGLVLCVLLTGRKCRRKHA
jgi:hypothetical protein